MTSSILLPLLLWELAFKEIVLESREKLIEYVLSVAIRKVSRGRIVRIMVRIILTIRCPTRLSVVVFESFACISQRLIRFRDQLEFLVRNRDIGGIPIGMPFQSEFSVGFSHV